MSSPQLTVQIVTWNSADVLRPLLESLRRQTLQDIQLIVIDNHSTDSSRDIVREMYPHATLITNDRNLGFSAAHNQGLRLSEAPFVALVNPDVIIPPTTLERLLTVLAAHPDFGSIGPKLLKNGDQSGIIDSAGIRGTRYREFLNRGEGEYDQGQYDEAEEVFGLSGAFLMLRREALEAIRIGNEYLDEDFFAYKDDVDLAWRLRLSGWKNWYEPSAVAFHARTVRHETDVSVWERRKRKGALMNRMNYRNHLLLLYKNDRIRDWIFPWPGVLLYEAAKLLFLPLFERSTLMGLFDAIRLLPRMRKKRRIIQRHRSTNRSVTARWFR